MYFPNKAAVGVNKKSTRHHCENFHETTSDFMLPNIPFIKKFPGKTGIKNLKLDFYSRCNPMPIPTMGIAYTKINWYFVPFRILWKGYSDFKGQSLHYNGTSGATFIENKPYFKFQDMMLQLTILNGYCDIVNNSNPVYDFYWTYRGETKKYKWNKYGIQVITILNQLGYNVGNIDDSNFKLNALPLLAFCKVIADCYAPKSWEDYESNYVYLYNLLNNNNLQQLSQTDLAFLFNWFTVVSFEDDYFNSAWNNPNGPNIEQSGIRDFTINVPGLDTNGEYVYNNNIIWSRSGNARLQVSASLLENYNITQEGLNYLKATDKYLKKNQIVGTKYWDRLLAHYGITTDKALLNVPELIRSDKVYYRFNEIYCQSDNTDTSLGDYAGSGESIDGSNIKPFNYFADEEGYLICVATIQPEICYGNGFDRDVLELDVLQDFTEEYDSCGVQAISPLEVYSGYDAPVTDWLQGNPWGFLPQYARDKVTISKCSGLMNLYSVKNEMARWNFMRWYGFNDFPYITSGQNYKKIQNSVMNCIGYGAGMSDQDTTGSQFTRIFYTNNNPNFNLYFKFSFDFWNNMKSLYAYENIADDDDTMVNFDINNNNK